MTNINDLQIINSSEQLHNKEVKQLLILNTKYCSILKLSRNNQ